LSRQRRQSIPSSPTSHAVPVSPVSRSIRIPATITACEAIHDRRLGQVIADGRPDEGGWDAE
jgi:hypothetical protein